MTRKPVEITTKFVNALNLKFKGKEGPMGKIVFSVISERKFDKITLPKWNDEPHGSAHAFVERSTGLLYRSASWKYPVSDARFNLNDAEEFARAVELADPVGNYLRRNYSRKTYSELTPASYKTA